MILDHENMFSKEQAITATAVSTNVVDLGPNQWAGNSHGGMPIPVILSVDEAFTATGAATLTISIETSNTEGSGYEVLHQLPAIPKADLVIGGVLPMSVHIPADAKRFVRLNYTVATGPFTAGKLTAGIVTDRQTNK